MAFALEPAPQLRACVVEHLVDRAAGRAQLVGDHVDLDLVHRHRDENLALPRRQLEIAFGLFLVLVSIRFIVSLT
jgi:hypothetical protein